MISNRHKQHITTLSAPGHKQHIIAEITFSSIFDKEKKNKVEKNCV